MRHRIDEDSAEAGWSMWDRWTIWHYEILAECLIKDEDGSDQ